VIENMASLPKTYRAASFVKPNEPLTIVDVDLKMPAVGEVLVKVIAVGKAGIRLYHGSIDNF
jgi:Zn-dependent alcohol dehydrogenase